VAIDSFIISRATSSKPGFWAARQRQRLNLMLHELSTWAKPVRGEPQQLCECQPQAYFYKD
jgi:hypothetical protein